MFKVDDKVVIYYSQPAPKLVNVRGTQVYFDCQHGISLAFVSEELVSPLLSYLGGCCGGKKKIFHLATEVQYKHWLDGKGGR